MKNVLIISGGSLDLNWAGEWLKGRSFDYVIVADRGLEYADELGIKVDFLLGDYDSVNSEVLDKYKSNTDMVTYPREKDYTDTHIAIKKAVEMSPDTISIIGATGTRLDHTMTNIGVMREAVERGINCAVFDKHNKIYLLSADTINSCAIEKNEQYGSYLSFVPMTESVILSAEGVKYPLENYNLAQGISLCQSNEIEGERALISVNKGVLIVCESRD